MGKDTMKILTVDKTKCNGCGACQVLCSAVKKNKVQPSESRIRIRRSGDPDVQNVSVCQHCETPVCVTACMRGCIHKDPATGFVRRNVKGCFACASCNVWCPIGAIFYDSDEDAFVTCDRCGGDPLCVRVCPTGALRYEEIGGVSDTRRQAYARSLFAGEGAE
mgnify:CR=1 FL=1